jgi:hypothetical protein
MINAAPAMMRILLFNSIYSLELVPKLIDYALKRMVLEQALGKTGQIGLKSGPVFPLIQGSCSKN